MNQEWNIQSRARVCAATEREFADGDEILSCLRYDPEADAYIRVDCLAAEAGEIENDPSVLSKWRSVFHPPPPPAPEALGKETAETLLRKYLAEEGDQHQNAAFILAAMLERKRLLVERHVHTTEHGARIRVYEHRQTGETFTVTDPDVRLADLADVQREVMAILQPPEPAAEAGKGEGAEEPRMDAQPTPPFGHPSEGGDERESVSP